MRSIRGCVLWAAKLVLLLLNEVVGSMSLGLVQGDRVCIIGGGPAGSFAALHLLRHMEDKNLDLEVLIFEPRDFGRPGPRGCNKCAGILSSRLMQGLHSLGLELSEDVVQSTVQSYAVHLDGDTLRLTNPNLGKQIVSVYRGAGPRMLTGEPEASFDQFLLDHAVARGAQLVPSRVRFVTHGERPIVHTANESFEADLIVLATGVNSRSPLDDDFGYQPPETAVMAQDEFLLPDGWPADQVSAHFDKPAGLIFGALIPKGKYLNVSLLGRDLSTDAVSDFVEAHSMSYNLHSISGSLCGCSPRIAVGTSKKYYGRRWVAVGDAAVTRLYKDGIGSAFFSAKRAMDIAMRRGISATAFRRYYAPFCRGVAVDNRYGKHLFRFWALTYRSRLLRRMWTQAIQAEADWPSDRRVHNRILWGMLTGDDSYRELFRLLISPSAILGLLNGLRISTSETSSR
jgi:flavin-dependent dehydrogenase